MAGDNDDRQIRINGPELIQQFKAIQTAALQPDIKDDQGRLASLKLAHRAIGVGRSTGFIAFIFQQTADQFADIRLVIHYQDVTCHRSGLLLRR